jgi:mRNA-degrading endonuclease RelE of RelBE toxin-antitoxin system
VSYQLEVFTTAKAEIRSLPGYVRAQAKQAIAALAHTPRPRGAKELRGKPGVYRLWLAGRWRIVYTIDDDQQVITILRVRRKEQIDYERLDDDNND